MMRDHGANAHPVIISAVAPTKTVYPNLIAGYLWLDTTVPALKRCTNADTPTYVNVETNLGAPTNVDYLVGTANGDLSAEIVVGTTPGGELGGTWASPTIDATHSGSSHANLPTGAQVNGVDIATISGSQTLTNKTIAAASNVLDQNLEDLAVLADPNADRIVFWDDSAGAIKYLTAGTGLTITDTTMSVSASSGAVTREGGNTTEGTTTSASDVDLLTASSLSVGVTEPFLAIAVLRKTGGAAAAASAGLKVNTTASLNAVAWSTAGDGTDSGQWQATLAGRVSSYEKIGYVQQISPGQTVVHSPASANADVPTEAVTDLTVRANSGSASITAGADELHVYSLAAS